MVSKKYVDLRMIMPAILFVFVSLSLLAIPFMINKKRQDEATPLLPSGYSNAIWEWANPKEADTSIFPLLKEDHFGDIFLDISTYVDLYEMPSGTKRDTEIKKFEEATRVYITQAKAAGISVHALVGAPKWGLSSHRYLNEILVDFVRDYNEHHPEVAFAGLHFDLEVYKAPGFDQNQKAYLLEYLDTMADIVDRINADFPESSSANFKIGVAIPAWFDGNHEQIRKIVWRGEEKFVFNHLAKIINQYGNSYIVVMAYRDTPDGPSGSIARAQDEIDFIAQYIPRIKMFVGLETKDIEPQTATFYGDDPAKLRKAALDIAKAFENKKPFSGIVIHDVEGYMELKK